MCRSRRDALAFHPRRLSSSSSAATSPITFLSNSNSSSSLFACLRNPNNPAFTPLSSWLSRMQIAADLAQGLDYIHHHAAARGCVHNRIRSSAVIVSDAGFHAKICHFGAAFLAGDADCRPLRIVGTPGYLAPEVIAGGRVTKKSDVYAFGIVLLELMSGEEPLECRLKDGGGERSYEWVSLVERAREVVGAAGWDGEGSERMERVRFWVDKRLKDSFPLAVAEKMVVVAVRCVESDVARRPEMSWVQGKISQLFLESKVWNEKIRAPVEISATFGPR